MIYVNFFIVITIYAIITTLVISFMYVTTKSFISELKDYFNSPIRISKENLFHSFLFFCFALIIMLVYILHILNYEELKDDKPKVKSELNVYQAQDKSMIKWID